ncbi:hypothetical protein CEXT_792661 [Caerostris extrusa]|uniref:Uncharacterized protein n=1 Tax=Caerostris extrusa TaxID=172846 RepID=A0AAV4N9V9_CAEEX|nr:hypothetical protein CEXT_792661 [Caerostris extrusa]
MVSLNGIEHVQGISGKGVFHRINLHHPVIGTLLQSLRPLSPPVINWSRGMYEDRQWVGCGKIAEQTQMVIHWMLSTIGEFLLLFHVSGYSVFEYSPYFNDDK